MLFGLSLLALTSASVAAESEPQGVEEVTVVADPFKRFDDTHWFVESQVAMPWPVPMYARQNKMVQIVGFDIRLQIFCEKALAKGRVREIACDISDAALSMAPFIDNDDRREVAQTVIEESVADLRGASIQLQVDARGRVVNVDIEDVQGTWRRETVRTENLRQILRSAVSGFHLKFPQPLESGKAWQERDTPIVSIPSFRSLNDGSVGLFDMEGAQASAAEGASSQLAGLGGGGGGGDATTAYVPNESRSFGSGRAQFDALTAAASRGVANLAHRIDRYQGQWVLQSAGEATVELGDEANLTYKGLVDGVSIIPADREWVTERVWTVKLNPVPTNLLTDGNAGWPVLMTGTLRQLDEGEQADLGGSLVTSPPGAAREGLPMWMSRTAMAPVGAPSMGSPLQPVQQLTPGSGGR